MRTKILTAVKVSTLAIVLSLGLNYAYAWTAPTVTPPGGNVEAPLNTSANDQTKTGGLLSAFNLWINNALGVTGGATFGGSVGIGTTAPIRRLHVGGGSGGGEISLGNQSNAPGGVGFINLSDDSGNGGDTNTLYIRGLNNGGTAGADLKSLNLQAQTTYMSGNVGIGTTNPGVSKLFVSGGDIGTNGDLNLSGATDKYQDAPWYGLGFNNNTADRWLGIGPIVQLGGYFGLQFVESGVTRMAIKSGNVGIGTTAPIRRLHVGGGSGGGEISLGNQSNAPGGVGFINLSDDSGNGGDTNTLYIRGLNNGGTAGADLKSLNLQAQTTYMSGNLHVDGGVYTNTNILATGALQSGNLADTTSNRSVCADTSGNLTICNAPGVTISVRTSPIAGPLSESGLTVAGQSTTLSWSSSGSPTSCSASASPTDSSWAASKGTSGSQTVTPPVSTVYTLSCTNASGLEGIGSVTVDVRGWQRVYGHGNNGESADQWLKMTGQAGVNGSKPDARQSGGCCGYAYANSSWYSITYSDPFWGSNLVDYSIFDSNSSTSGGVTSVVSSRGQTYNNVTSLIPYGTIAADAWVNTAR